ncbi:MAG: hypothetical protein FWF59_05910, partial [Turicibacter sp.]|nr:hypothetical protein [Turicibacter sp.]
LIIKISLLSWYPNYTVTESWILFVLLFDAYFFCTLSISDFDDGFYGTISKKGWLSAYKKSIRRGECFFYI